MRGIIAIVFGFVILVESASLVRAEVKLLLPEFSGDRAKTARRAVFNLAKALPGIVLAPLKGSGPWSEAELTGLCNKVGIDGLLHGSITDEGRSGIRRRLLVLKLWSARNNR